MISVIQKLWFSLWYVISLLLPEKLQLQFAEYLLNKSSSPTLGFLVPRQRGWNVFFAALLRASLKKSVSLHLVKGGFYAIPQRITIGESVMYYDYALLQATKNNWTLRAIDLGIYPCKELIPFFYQKEQILKIDNPLHALLKKRVEFKKENKDKALVDLYVNNVVGKLYGKSRIPDIFKPYQSSSDSILKEVQKKEPSLAKSYFEFVSGENCIEGASDYCRLAEETSWNTDRPRFPGFSATHKNQLLKELGIDGPYVGLFLRPIAGDLTSPRSIHNISAYRAGIQFLRERGYKIVLLGTDGSTLFPDVANLESEGLVDYPRSGKQSLINDLHLVEGSKFMIVCTSGPSSFPILFRVPALWLNTLLPAQSVMLSEHRFFPKTIRSKDGNKLGAKEWMKSPALYAQHRWHFDVANLSYEDLTANEIHSAVEEFLNLVEQKNPPWKERTNAQKHLLSKTESWHLHLKTFTAAPCDSFIKTLRGWEYL